MKTRSVLILALLSVMGVVSTSSPACRLSPAKLASSSAPDNSPEVPELARGATSPISGRLAVRAWLETVDDTADIISLLGTPHPPPGPAALRGRVPDAVFSAPLSLRPDHIALCLAAGPQAIPELIKRLHDRRTTPWAFQYPLSSFDGGPGMRVGEIACYMLEAILRQNPYFTSTGRLLYTSVDGSRAGDERDAALLQAADAYSLWYEQCFDEASGRITCPPEQLPTVAWDYDWEAWPALVRLDGELKDMFRDVPGLIPAEGDENVAKRRSGDVDVTSELPGPGDAHTP
ncbi:MAG TPA: hypothetical protein PKK06_05015 [Phycisphaerae bacterium]|nr:hypothetical protein [Phycisphaerae bacterium]